MDDVSSRLRERSQSHLDAAARDFDAPLAGRGFMRRPFERDHVPAGHEGPPERWAKRLWVRRDASEAAVNLHVRVRGSPDVLIRPMIAIVGSRNASGAGLKFAAEA